MSALQTPLWWVLAETPDGLDGQVIEAGSVREALATLGGAFAAVRLTP